jgi:hypothetical protein
MLSHWYRRLHWMILVTVMNITFYFTEQLSIIVSTRFFDWVQDFSATVSTAHISWPHLLPKMPKATLVSSASATSMRAKKVHEIYCRFILCHAATLKTQTEHSHPAGNFWMLSSPSFSTDSPIIDDQFILSILASLYYRIRRSRLC